MSLNVLSSIKLPWGCICLHLTDERLSMHVPFVCSWHVLQISLTSQGVLRVHVLQVLEQGLKIIDASLVLGSKWHELQCAPTIQVAMGVHLFVPDG